MGFWAFSKFGPRRNHLLGYNQHPKSTRQKKVQEKKKNKKRKRDESPAVSHSNALIVEDLEIGALDNNKASNGSTVKIIMKHKVGKRRDRISDLPISILHRILSFLPPSDVAVTSVLSKQWNCTRKSFPRLKFIEPESKVILSKDKERRGKYLDYVDRSLQYFVQHKLCIESMDLNLSLQPSDFFPVVDTLLPLALHRGASEISFSSIPYLYALPETTFVVNSSIPCGYSTFFRLQKLTLVGIILSENIVRNINDNCPNIAEFVLDSVRGFETFNISKPNKLVSLTILRGKGLNNVSIDAPFLDQFIFELIEPREQCVIDVTLSYNMRKLELVFIYINDDLFHLHISRFSFLEVLNIMYCHVLRRIRISLQRLKYLQVCYCNSIEAIEIDSPILSEFKFEPRYTDLPRLVSTNTNHGSMEFCYTMNFRDGQVNTLLFLEIREYLARAPFDRIIFQPRSGRIQVNYDPNEVKFEIEELKEAIIPPLVEVECLDLGDLYIEHSAYCPSLIQGLIWSCHPKRVTMCHNNIDCIKVFCQMVNRTKCLKTATIESIGGMKLNIESTGGIERKKFRYLLDNLSSIPKYSKVVFKLEWDHLAIQGLTLF